MDVNLTDVVSWKFFFTALCFFFNYILSSSQLVLATSDEVQMKALEINIERRKSSQGAYFLETWELQNDSL